MVVFILPTWSIWPASLLTGLTYFFTAVAKFNFIFPIDTLFTVILFIINFEVLYLTAKLIMKVFNYVRGTGSGLDL
jgi:hypothetical protein